MREVHESGQEVLAMMDHKSERRLALGMRRFELWVVLGSSYSHPDNGRCARAQHGKAPFGSHRVSQWSSTASYLSAATRHSIGPHTVALRCGSDSSR